MTFSVSMDKRVLRRTIAFSVILVLLPLARLFFIGFVGSDGYIADILFLSLIVLAYCQKPMRYRVDEGNILVQFPFSGIRISRNEISSVVKADQDLLGDVWGGVFGYYGNYDTILGEVRSYATRSDRLVLITKADGKKILLSPDQPDAFIDAVNNKTVLSGAGRASNPS